jgi:UDP-N-acetylmuramate dehydrogenase
MYILENVPLSGYSTMRLGGTAAFLTEVSSRTDLTEALAWADERDLPVIMIGGGSNTIWKDERFTGLVMVNKILRFETFKEDDDNLYVTIGSGEPWDDVVDRTVNLGYSGIEFLSLIPGFAGAAPIQNIGAYGHEIADTLVSVEAYDRHARQFINIPASDCGFGYRTSRFKTIDKGRFLITSVTLHLTRTPVSSSYYHSLQSYFAEHNITERTPAAVRQAVIAIRSSKLPDPAVIANTGSFFANPIISKNQFEQLLDQHPRFKSWHSPMHWELDNNRVKIAAGALLEYLDLKGVHDNETGMATWPKQALVLVNEHAQTTADLLKFRQKILDRVRQTFGITLEQEPELLP